MSGALAQAERPIPWQQWAGFLAMVLGMFMSILDIQIVSASISEIQAGLSASPDEVSYVQTSYLIAEIIMIPLSGWLSRLWSTRWLFTISALGFTLCSLACATADGLGEMVIFRAAQGFIGGAMIPTVFATSFLIFPNRVRSKVQILIGLTATLAPTIGPTLGGWLTQEFNWHWLFLINVPVGILVAVCVWIWMDIDKPNPSLAKHFDMLGLIYLAAFLGSMEYVLEEGNRNDWFADPLVRDLGIVSVVGGVLFFWRMFTRPEPLVDMRAFRNVNFAFGCLYAFLIGIGLYGSVYLIPLFLGRVRGYDSMQIGETMFVTGVAMFLSAPIIGRLSAVLDTRRMLTVGVICVAVSIWWLGHLTNQSAFWELMAPQMLRGFGTMLCMVPTNQLALGTLPPQQIKNASGLFNLMRNLGGAIGLAGINTLATAREQLHTLHLAEQVTWARSATMNAVQGMTLVLHPVMGQNTNLAVIKRLTLMVERESLTQTYNDIFLIIGAIYFVSVPLSFLLRKPAKGGGGGGGH
jgi:MFS transporter, DHA2 family, multidrug resistance protein